MCASGRMRAAIGISAYRQDGRVPGEIRDPGARK